ncbi:Crp/Fnr family transcriptional regulator [Pedobacter cryoconitis]|uniref:CRP-like cAMP-binding protein n=1 Tax=Pedobacter cryoconitis TaxID=188932 RepID=A0A327SVQ7_9SPHI|nr:Crp/Fnr family transcriptional regulator [Pedobacter cryoconitis]RAJ33009.1 CRP-like cAMP-binding protein [Pedobacter cryoconitis]
MQNDNFQPIFDFLRLYRAISESDQTLINLQLQFRKVKEGEVLLQQGKLARELFFVCKGILKIVSFSDKGNPVTQFFLKEHRFCTILNSLNDSVPANESIIAACDAELIVLSKDKLLHLYDAIPYFKDLTTTIFQQSLLEKIKVRNSYMGEDATTRYQKFILQQPDIALRVPLSDVASYLGITQQSLSRIRKNIR